MKNTDRLSQKDAGLPMSGTQIIEHGPMVERAPKHGTASQYLIVETVMSGLVNGILNLAAGYALFHRSGVVPATGGPRSLLRDSIGETFLVAALSFLVPSLIARHRRRAGTLPISSNGRQAKRPSLAGNLYVRALIIGLLFTCVLVPCNAFLLPRIFPEGVSFRNVLLFKTLYGIVLGSIATLLALRKALHEVD